MFRELSRKSQLLSPTECIEVLIRETRGVLSVLGDDEYPYGTPMNHWYCEADECIYFHCGKFGHRLDSLRRHEKASFCVYTNGEKGSHPWGLTVKSVVAFGRVEIVEDPQTVIDVTRKLSEKFTSDEEYIRQEIAAYADKTLLLRLKPEHLCGKSVTEA